MSFLSFLFKMIPSTNHNIIGGLGSAVAEVLSGNCPVPLERIGRVMRSEFGKTYSATLTDGTQVPVSRGKYGALREHLAAEGIQFV